MKEDDVSMNKKVVNTSVKKRIMWVLIGVLVIAVFVLSVKYVYPIISFYHASTWKLCADYEEYANDFNLVKDYIAAEFPNESDKVIIVAYQQENGNALYDSDIMELLTLPDDVNLALNTICKNGFPNKDSTLGAIRIHEGRISFCIENGNYALVHSPDSKPTWVNSPSENTGVKVKKIQDNWYHVVKKR